MPAPVYDDEKTKAEDLEAITGIGKEEQAAMQQRAADGAADDILAQEDAASGSNKDSTPGFDYNPANVLKKRGFQLTGRQKRGGIIGLVLSIAIAGFSLINLGPLQFIHFSQLLSAIHFSDQEDAANSRTSRLVKWMLYDKQPEKTRLGIIANKQADKVELKLKANGVTVNYSKELGLFRGFTIDPSTAKEGVFKDLNRLTDPEQKRLAVAAALDVDPKFIDVSGNKVTVKADGLKRVKNGKLIGNLLDISINNGKISSSYQKRLLIRRAGLTFNPLTKLDRALNDKAVETFKKAREARLAGKEAGTFTANPGETEDDERNRQSAVAAEEANGISQDAKSGDAEAAKGRINKIAPGGKIAIGGGLAAGGIGLVCLVQSVAESVNTTQKIERAGPLMQLGSEIVSVGSKTQAGDDIDVEALGIINEGLHNETKGQESSWHQARSLQYENDGSSDGTTLPSEINPNPAKGPIADFLNQPGLKEVLGTACPILNNPFVVAITALPNLASSVVTFAASAAFMDDLIAALAGKASNLADPKYAGAVTGEAVNVGTLLMANETSSAMGGRPLSDQETAIVKAETTGNKKLNDKSRSIADRYLNPYKYDTLTARAINTNKQEALEATAKLPALLFSKISFVFIGNADAAETTAKHSDIYYGIPKVGFAPGMLDSDEFDNPYQNANQAADIIKATGDKYKKLLEQCNKISVVETNGAIDFVSMGEPVIDYTNDKLPKECKDDSDKNFVKIRIAALDTVTMKSLACTQFDDEEACAEISGSTSSNEASNASATSNDVIAGNTSSIQCAAGKDGGIVEGWKEGEKYQIRVCNVQGIVVNSEISGNVDALLNNAKKSGIKLGGGGYRTNDQQIKLRQDHNCPDIYNSPSEECSPPTARPGYSNHQMGLAIDFTCEGKLITGSANKCFQWLRTNAKNYGLINYPVEAWHWSVDGK